MNCYRVLWDFSTRDLLLVFPLSYFYTYLGSGSTLQLSGFFLNAGLLPRKSVRSGKWPKFVRILALSLPRDDIDRLFDSAARSYGKRLIGVLLTGRLHDGTRGMQAVKQHGGVTVIQDPNSAAYPSMPKSVARQCQIDYCLPLVQIAPLLQRLVGTRLPLELESHDR